VTELAGHYPSALAKLILDGLEAQFERLFHEVNVASPEGPAEVVHETDEDEDLDDDDDGDGDQPDDNPEVGEIGDGLHADPEGRAPGAEALEDAEAVVPVADGGDQPTTAEKKLAAHLHEMTGHRPVLCLARALVLTGAQPGLVKAVKQHKFEVCQELPTVKTHRPAGIPHACNFGDRIYSDLFAVPDVRLETFWIAHAIDGATRYQVAKVLDNKTALEVVKFMEESWFQPLGIPASITVDMGKEFTSALFMDKMSYYDVAVHHIPVEAPWQNGLAERSGGVLKAVLRTTIRQTSALGMDDVVGGALTATLEAINTDTEGVGYSPSQWFLERIHELWELLEEMNFAHSCLHKLELMKQVLQECKQ